MIDPRQALRGRRQTWAEVDLDALARNVRLIRRRVGAGRRLLAVVKADAYGHGAAAVARRLEAEGTELLGVAIPEEGLELRGAGITAPILVLGAADPSQLPGMLDLGLIPTVYSAPFLDAVLAQGARAGRPIPCHLKVDTGMGRLGLLPGDVPGALARLSAAPERGTLQGVFTTLSCSDDPKDPHTLTQMNAFLSVLEEIRRQGFAPSYVHAANSGGVLHHPSSWLDTIRPGIMLYGIHPSARSVRLDLDPVLSLKTRLVLIKRVPAGTPLGYSRAFVTTRPSVIGTVAAGYADGLSRIISDRGHALVRGRRAPFAGRISMDHGMLDLTDMPDAGEGDEVVLFGRQGNEEISLEEFAGWAQTIPYEALCRVGPRVLRLYLQDDPAADIL